MDLESFILGFFEFIGNVDFNMFSTVIGAVLILFWLVIVGWVWMDSGERTSKMQLRVAFVLLATILNIPGLIIYLIVRPSETIEEIYWADLERRYLKYETAELGDCTKCGHQLFPGFVFCTNCGNEIKKKCPKCGVLISKDHKYCQHCGLQLRDRATVQEQYPNVEVMEKQIIATKEHATQTVESKRTRYKTGESLVVRLGDSIISLFAKIKQSVPKKVVIENVKEKVLEKKQQVNINQRDSSFKKKKNKKKKKR